MQLLMNVTCRSGKTVTLVGPCFAPLSSFSPKEEDAPESISVVLKPGSLMWPKNPPDWLLDTVFDLLRGMGYGQFMSQTNEEIREQGEFRLPTSIPSQLLINIFSIVRMTGEWFSHNSVLDILWNQWKCDPWVTFFLWNCFIEEDPGKFRYHPISGHEAIWIGSHTGIGSLKKAMTSTEYILKNRPPYLEKRTYYGRSLDWYHQEDPMEKSFLYDIFPEVRATQLLNFVGLFVPKNKRIYINSEELQSAAYKLQELLGVTCRKEKSLSSVRKRTTCRSSTSVSASL